MYRPVAAPRWDGSVSLAPSIRGRPHHRNCPIAPMEDHMPQTTFHLPPFSRDSRGNRLLRWQAMNESGGHVLWLCGPSEVVDQLIGAVPEYTPLPLSAEATRRWTHSLRARGPLRSDVASLLELLTTVVSLPSPPNIDTAIALDWYKVP